MFALSIAISTMHSAWSSRAAKVGNMRQEDRASSDDLAARGSAGADVQAPAGLISQRGCERARGAENLPPPHQLSTARASPRSPHAWRTPWLSSAFSLPPWPLRSRPLHGRRRSVLGELYETTAPPMQAYRAVARAHQ